MPLGRGLQKISRKGEDQTAKDIGGRRQPGSGNGPFAKADVKSEMLLVERKDTQAASFVVKRSELDKLRKQASLASRFPVFQVAFQPSDKSYAVVDWALFLEMYVVYAEHVKQSA